jgi:predicted metalloprotease
MQWFGGKESDDVEEGSSSGGGRGFAVGGGVVGLIGLVIYLFTGINPTALLNGGQDNGGQQQQVNTRVTGPESPEKKQARMVFQATEDVWDSLFTAQGKTFQKPILHFFTGGVDAACGYASSATGPFYCPQDRKVYIDLSFYKELSDKFGAPGEFAQAYVIAHEVGHHVQNLLGVSQKVENAESQAGSEAERNKYSVALELQADFYAGIWAHYENKYHQNGLVLNEADIASALNAAKQIGDDHLQQETQGRVEPDSFTHGTSAQRMYWFKKGFDAGDLSQGNTFAKMDLL